MQNQRSIRAVVVTEHENISSLLLDDRFGVQDNIIVTTSGYPGHSTTEFLHLLSKDALLKGIPFLYIADHDFHGLHIFSVLKYGCRSSAWASEIQTCSQLRWIGPSRDDLVKSPALYLPQWEVQYKTDNPRATDAEVKKAATRWQSQLDKKIDQKFVKTYKKDRELHRGFVRTGWLQYKPAVRRELDLMLCQDCKFRVADLALVSTRYLQIFMETKIEEACPLKTVVQKGVAMRAPARRSPVGERFKEIESQAQASDQSASASVQPVTAASELTAEELDRDIAAAIAEMR